MKSQWLAYVLSGSVSFCVACKGDGGSGSGTSFLEVVETSPENGREDVPVELRIAVRVSEVIDPATLTNQTFVLTDEDGAVVPSTVNILDEPNAAPSEMGTAALLEPDEPLTIITSFTVTLTTGLRSINGTSLEEDYDWTFKTLDSAWGESEWIEPLGAWSSSRQEIAVDEQLNAIAVWELDDGVGDSIYANRYNRIDLWGEPEPIDDGNGGATKPKLAVDSAGNGFAVWERLDAGTSVRHVWANHYDVADGSWGVPALLQNGDVTRARIPSVAANSAGNATAVWVQDNLDTGRQVIRAIRYEPGAGWGDAVTVGSPTTVIAAGRIAVGMDDQGNAIAVWDPPAGPAGQGGRVLWANRYTPASDWGEAVPIKSDDTTSANDFRLDVGTNGDAFVIWVQDNGSEAEPRDDIWAARFSGDAWSAPARIDRHDGGDKRAPDVAVDGAGIAYAIWSQVDPDFANIWAAQHVPASGWATPELVEPPNEDPTKDGDATTPRVDVNRAGNAFVVWRQNWDQWGSVWSNRLDPGTSWMTAERIEDAPATANLPTIAVDDARHAHAIWLHTNSGTPKVRTNRFE